jgi:hypothetical protein
MVLRRRCYSCTLFKKCGARASAEGKVPPMAFDIITILGAEYFAGRRSA